MLDGKSDEKVGRTASEAAVQLRRSLHGDDEVLGPAPGVLAKLRDRYRHHILLKIKSEQRVQAALTAVAGLRPPSTVKIKVNVDPYDFF